VFKTRLVFNVARGGERMRNEISPIDHSPVRAIPSARMGQQLSTTGTERLPARALPSGRGACASRGRLFVCRSHQSCGREALIPFVTSPRRTCCSVNVFALDIYGRIIDAAVNVSLILSSDTILRARIARLPRDAGISSF